MFYHPLILFTLLNIEMRPAKWKFDMWRDGRIPMFEAETVSTNGKHNILDKGDNGYVIAFIFLFIRFYTRQPIVSTSLPQKSCSPV